MSSAAATGRRGAGRPLVAILALLTVWVAIRASVWEPPFAPPSPDALFAQAQTDETDAVARSQAPTERLQARGGRTWKPHASAPGHPASNVAPGGGWIDFGRIERVPGVARGLRAVPFARARSSASHQRLFAAAYGSMPEYASLIERGFSPGLSGQPGRAPRLAFPDPPQAVARARGPVAETARLDRWSADAWLLVREGSNRQGLSSVNPAALGADQVGAVVRYTLAPESYLQPQAYVRASKALVANGEVEGAAGVSLAPSRNLPLRLHAELRVTERAGRAGRAVEARPAVYVTTGLSRRELGPDIEGEAYLQAGYVGGDFETGFVDGKATLEAPLLKRDKGRVAVGAGAWGGAQRDASRFDIGPTASVALATGKASLHASIDYRFRVAGDAVPDDGLAVTLTASF